MSKPRRKASPPLICPSCGSANCHATGNHNAHGAAQHAVCVDCGTARPIRRFKTGGPPRQFDVEVPVEHLGRGGIRRTAVRYDDEALS